MKLCVTFERHLRLAWCIKGVRGAEVRRMQIPNAESPSFCRHPGVISTLHAG
jgi:hypothetical protein